MDSVFDLIFNLFNSVIGWLKEIPVSDDLSLFDFSIAILIMSIVAVAFVSVVQVRIGSNVDTARIIYKAHSDSSNDSVPEMEYVGNYHKDNKFDYSNVREHYNADFK